MRSLGFAVGGVLSLSVILGLGDGSGAAEPYPAKPITFIVAGEAGADSDILCRPLVQKASAVLGQPMVVVNKPGAGSSIGFRELHDAKPDGYTIGWGGLPLIISKLQGIMPYDYHEFTLLGTFYVLHNNVFGSTKTKRPFKTMEEVISFARSNPGEVSIATGGIGMNTWIGGMALQIGTGLKFNIIPQPGAGGFIAAQVGGGHMDLGIAALPSMKSQLDAGNVRYLAVLGSKRAPGYKDVPTVKELGYDVQNEACGFVMGPPKLPKEVVDRLVKAFEIAANDPEYQKFILDRFTMPLYLPPEKIIPYLDGQRQVLRSIMEKAGILKEK